MEKKKLFNRIMWAIAIVVFLVTEIIGLCFGRVIEGSLFAEIAKWVVMGIGLSALVCGVFYALVATIASRKGE